MHHGTAAPLHPRAKRDPRSSRRRRGVAGRGRVAGFARSARFTGVAGVTRIAALAGMLGAVLASSSGCAVWMAARQPGKKDLGVLGHGVSRSRVLAEIGPPVATTQRDGKTVDVFAFKQGYGKLAKTGRVLLHGTADVLTLGLWELVGTPGEMYFDGHDVKVEITYDDLEQVERVVVLEGEEVIRPGPRFAWGGAARS